VVRSISREAASRIPARQSAAPVLEARMGGATALRASAREALPDFYARAVSTPRSTRSHRPRSITSGERAAVAFEATVQVRPLISLPGYDGLVVTVPTGVTDESSTHRSTACATRRRARRDPAAGDRR